jgi:hypothetical protein
VEEGCDPEFVAHCCRVFNERYLEMVTPECHLALLLHPFYRASYKYTKHPFSFYYEPAAQILKNYKQGTLPNLSALANQMREYIAER